MKKLDLRLFRLIKTSKGQFIAITALIITGLCIYTALSMAIVNLEYAVNHYYTQTNFADIYVQLSRAPDSAIEKIMSINGVKDAEGRLVFDVNAEYGKGKEKTKTRIVSVADDSIVNQLYMIDGDTINKKSKDVIVIQQFADAREVEIGDSVRPIIEGKIVNLSVCGISASPEYVYLMENEQSLLPMPDKFAVIFVSQELAALLFGFRESYNEILITVKNSGNIDSVVSEVEKLLEQYGVKRIYTRDEQLSNRMVLEEIKGVKQMSETIPIIFLGVAAVIIAAMLSRMVKNDRMSIGVLKALGYSNINILIHYVKISSLIGFIGSVLGISIGSAFSGSIAELYAQFFNIPILQFAIYYKYYLAAMLLSIIFTTLAGFYGARGVLKIVPAESMRPEPPKKGGRVFLDRIDFFWRRLSFSWKMVIRNIFRNKKRFFFITFGIALTYSISLMPAVINMAVDEIFEGHYSEFQKMDYNINFTKPLKNDVINEIKHLVNVDKIEPKIEYPFELKHGNVNITANIIGVYSNTEFYNFIGQDGSTKYIPKKGIVISEGLSRFLGVKKGDKIKIGTFIPNRKDVYVEVKEIIKQSLGMNGYMNIDTMSETLLDKNAITGVYIDSKDKIKEKLENTKNILSIQSMEDMRLVFEQFMGLVIGSISIMILFSGILGFAVVYNSTIMTIAERRLEFSSLRVMGFSKKEIFRTITKENIIMTCLGILLGIPMGRSMLLSLGNMFSTEIYSIEMNPAISGYVITIFLTATFVILAQLATYRKINKLDFIEALKNRIS